jgi:hypothetical protein
MVSMAKDRWAFGGGLGCGAWMGDSYLSYLPTGKIFILLIYQSTIRPYLWEWKTNGTDNNSKDSALFSLKDMPNITPEIVIILGLHLLMLECQVKWWALSVQCPPTMPNTIYRIVTKAQTPISTTIQIITRLRHWWGVGIHWCKTKPGDWHVKK